MAPRNKSTSVNILPNGCWEWTGSLALGKHPISFMGGKQIRVCYLQYEKKHNYIPRRVEHTCGFSKCINPSHLFDPDKTPSNTRIELSKFTVRKHFLIDMIETLKAAPQGADVIEGTKLAQEELAEINAELNKLTGATQSTTNDT